MRNKILPPSRRVPTAVALLLACVLLPAASATAQSLQNGNFEKPLDPWDPSGLTGGKTNWTLVYWPGSGGPGDWAVHDRTVVANYCVGGVGDCTAGKQHGAHFRPRTDNWCRAYFTQTVSNLTVGASYVFSGYVALKNTSNTATGVTIQAIGASPLTTNSSPAIVGDWALYSVTNTATPGGTMEVRLEMNKAFMSTGGPDQEKYWALDAMFDLFTLTKQQ